MSKSKKSRGAKTKTPSAPVPGAVGGPGTATGVNYQVDYAVEKALGLISRSLCAPFTNWVVRMEPRAGGAAGPTQWDLGIGPPESLIEVKFNPTRGDILDWVSRLATAAVSPGGHFVLVYARGGGTLLPSLEKLVRNANEAAGDAAKFASLLAMETIPEAAVLLGKVGADPHLILRRARIECHPEPGLAEDIDMRACLLVGERDAKRLVALLFRKFAQGMTRRMVFPVRDLIDEIQGEGMTLNAPPKVDPADLPPAAVSGIAILQACPDGVPIDVLAQAAGSTQAELLTPFNRLMNEGTLTQKGDIWSIRPTTNVNHGGIEDLLARTLDALLAYSRAHKSDGGWRSQVRNVIVLSERCMATHPAVVQGVYQPLEKLLKRKGDKRLVLVMSGLAVEAARRAGRGDEEVRAEAQALICGQSWVYQRIDRLAEARAFAEKSLELGMQVGWDRNTAFRKKCIGRLKRMEAECLGPGPERDRLLAESVASLEEGIRRFGALGDFGPTHPEVGECYSLLGRTYLVSGQLEAAARRATEAEQLLTDPMDKDYRDLQILKGDLAAAEGEREGADDHYEAALGPMPAGDTEQSEIRARAIYRRGLNRAAGGQTGAAINDFEESRRLWRDLGEHRAAAAPAWNAIQLDATLPAGLTTHVTKEPPVIRVAAVDAYKLRLTAFSGIIPPVLANPSAETCAQLVDEARKWVAINVIDW